MTIWARAPTASASLRTASGDFVKVLKAAERPLIIVGAGVFARTDGAALAAAAAKAGAELGAVKDGWNGFYVLHTAAARVGALDIGFVPGDGGRDASPQWQPGGTLDVSVPARRR